MNKFLGIFLMLILSASMVIAATITPQKGIDLRDIYNISNIYHIDANQICFGNDCRTAWLNATNITTADIQALGFNTTVQLDNYFYSINNPNGYINSSALNGYNTTAELNTLYYSINNPNSYINSSNLLNYMFTNGTNSNISQLNFNVNPIFNKTIGTLYWDVVDKTLALEGEAWTLQIGQEIYAIVYNDKGYTIPNGVAVTQDGAIGDQPTIALADSSSIFTGIVLGVTTQAIAPGQTGMVTILGVVHDLNTSAWAPDTTLYVSSTIPGQLTDVFPSPSPAYPMTIGQVLKQDAVIGSMFVRPRTAEIDPVWSNDKLGYYNALQVDILLNNKLNITDQRYNDTFLIEAVNNSLGNYLLITDQRYNDTFLIEAVNNSLGNYLLITDQRYNDTNLINVVNTTSNIQTLGFNTTVQLDGRYYSITNPNGYINITQVPPSYNDSALNSRIDSVNQTAVNALPANDQRYNDTSLINNLNQSLQGQINTKVDGNGTNGTLAMWNGTNILIDSPIKQVITDEDYLTIYNGTIYADQTNEVTGINVVPGTESHEATFSVNTNWRNGTGILTTGAYNSVLGYTDVTSNILLPESITWSTNILYNNTEYFVLNYVNRTLIGIQGNYTGVNALTLTNWQYKPSPYSDVNGNNTDERGYSISTNGHWKWVMYVPALSNDTQLCFQSTEFSNVVCMDNTGNFQINGKLTATSVSFPRYAGFRQVPTITNNGDGSINISSGVVNCYSGNVYTGTLTSIPIAAATTGVGGVPPLINSINYANYVVADCDLGTPVWTVLSDPTLLFSNARYALLATILRVDDPILGKVLHQQTDTDFGYAKSELGYTRTQDTQGLAISASSTITLSVSNLNVSVSGFNAWAGYTRYSIPATSNITIGAFVYPLGLDINSTPIWNFTLSQSPKYDNLHYANGTALVNFTTGYYGIVDVWKGVENDNFLYMFPMNTEYANFAQADAVLNLATVPQSTTLDAVFIGRIIFQTNNASNVVVKLKTNQFVTSSPNQNHNSLSGLQGGSSGNYLHLGLPDYTDIINHIFLNATDQRYNNTALINAVNTTANIESLGFNTTTQLNALYYNISNPNGYINGSYANATYLLCKNISGIITCITPVLINNSLTLGMVDNNVTYASYPLNFISANPYSNGTLLSSIQAIGNQWIFTMNNSWFEFDSSGTFFAPIFLSAGVRFEGSDQELAWTNFGNTSFYVVDGEIDLNAPKILVAGNYTLNGNFTILENATSICTYSFLRGMLIGHSCSNYSIPNTYGYINSSYANATYLLQTDQRYNDTVLANSKATPGNCAAGTVVQNTTTGGVQCVAVAGAYLAGTGITLNGSTFNINDTYVNSKWNDTVLINVINTTSNIQSLGFNTTAQLTSYYNTLYNDTAAYLAIDATKLNITDQRYNDTALANQKALPGNCPSGQYVVNTTTSGVQCAVVNATGDGTGGWTNNSVNTSTSLTVNINAPSNGINIGGHISVAQNYILDVIQNSSANAVIGVENTNTGGFSGVDLYTSSGTLAGGYGYGNSGTGMYAGYYYIDGTNAPIGFFSGGSFRGVLTTGGLWGINTASPATTLDVNGTITEQGATLNAKYNDSAKINAVNTTANIESLGFTNIDYAEAFNTTTGGNVTMTTQNVFYNVSGLGAGELLGWQLLSGQFLNCTDAGLYQVIYNINGAVNNNDVIEYQVIINTTTVESKGFISYRYSTGLNAFASKTFNRRFSVGDRIFIQYRDTTRAGAVFTYASREITINKIGN